MDDQDRDYLESELTDDVVTKEYKLWMDKDEELDQESGEAEVLDFNKPDFNFIPNKTHNWKQRGYYIHCTSCELGHGVFIGENRLMVGIDQNGEPIIKHRSELKMA